VAGFRSGQCRPFADDGHISLNRSEAAPAGREDLYYGAHSISRFQAITAVGTAQVQAPHGAKMTSKEPLRVRKRLLAEPGSTSIPLPSNEIDLVACATIHYSSEDPRHPIEHLLDGRSGRGATHWSSARDNTAEEIVIEFDRPENVLRFIFDAEEVAAERTQQVTMEHSTDGGNTYRIGFVQEYTFSPQGSTYQREDLSFNLPTVTHVKLTIVPNKGGTGRASLTSLRLFG
jgi:hypothetical protein